MMRIGFIINILKYPIYSIHHVYSIAGKHFEACSLFNTIFLWVPTVIDKEYCKIGNS